MQKTLLADAAPLDNVRQPGSLPAILHQGTGTNCITLPGPPPRPGILPSHASSQPQLEGLLALTGPIQRSPGGGNSESTAATTAVLPRANTAVSTQADW